MTLDKINQWLSLLANVGVLVGLAFLIAELNQANRIAVYTAESTQSSQFIGMIPRASKTPRSLPR